MKIPPEILTVAKHLGEGYGTLIAQLNEVAERVVLS